MNKQRLFLYFLPAILVTCNIFGLSLQPGGSSTQMTGALSNTLANALSIDGGTTEGTIHGIGGINIERINLLIRSLAHVIAFGGLGLMILLGCVLSKLGTRVCIYLTLLWGILVAFVDEGIKLFIPGRHFNLIDAGKDIVGILLALLGCWILQQLYLLYLKRRTPNSSQVHNTEETC